MDELSKTPSSPLIPDQTPAAEPAPTVPPSPSPASAPPLPPQPVTPVTTATVPLSPSPASGRRNVRLLSIMVAVTVLVLVGLFGTAVVYLSPSSSAFAQKIARVIPFPAATMDGNFITFREYYEQRATPPYAQDTTTEPTELDRQALTGLLQIEIMKAVAKQQGIASADPAKIDEAYRSLAESSGGEEAFAEQILSQFAMTPEEFRSQIVSLMVINNALEEKLQKDEAFQQETKQVLLDAKARMDNGEAFETVAEEVSVKEGIAWQSTPMALENFPPEWQDKMKDLSEGTVSEVLDSGAWFALLQKTKDGYLVLPIAKKNAMSLFTDYLEKAHIWRFDHVDTKKALMGE